MTNYYSVENWKEDLKLRNIPNEFWFSNPIKKDGYRHELMVELWHIDHRKNSRTFSISESCTMTFYKYGNLTPIKINGWTFLPDKIKGKYASTLRFTGMEMWFKCIDPNGETIEWYSNSRDSNCDAFIKRYFNEICRISKYHSIKEAKEHTYNDPYLKVWR